MKQCKKCKYYNIFLDSEYGMCTRRAPIALPRSATTRDANKPITANKYYSSEVEWPRVHPDWDCGEFKYKINEWRALYYDESQKYRAAQNDLKLALRRIAFRDKKIKTLQAEIKALKKQNGGLTCSP